MWLCWSLKNVQCNIAIIHLKAIKNDELYNLLFISNQTYNENCHCKTEMVTLRKHHAGKALFLNSYFYIYLFFDIRFESHGPFFKNRVSYFLLIKAYIFFSFLPSLSKDINIHWNFKSNQLFIHIYLNYKKITIASPKTYSWIYIMTPSLEFDFSILRAG